MAKDKKPVIPPKGKPGYGENKRDIIGDGKSAYPPPQDSIPSLPPPKKPPKK